MIIRTLHDLQRDGQAVAWGNGTSRRFLLARDGLGFTVTDTLVDAGTASTLCYRRHLEACYCIEGEGEVEADGQVHVLRPGTLYAPSRGETHTLRARTTLRLVCVFVPALEGPEAHVLDGETPSSY